jgi:precorrin-3B synthase
MNARPPLPLRRGACPGLSAPMPTGDGLLLRLVPVDAMPLDAFTALCAAARAHGNGAMEVTTRGSLQVRGLTPGSAPLFASEVAALDIAAHDGVAVLAGPLRDDPGEVIDSRGLAARLRRAIAEAGLALAPKVSVIVDGGGRLHLDALSADVRLLAVGPACTPRFLVALGTLLPLPEGGRVGEGGAGRMRGVCRGSADPLPNPPPEEGGGGAPHAWLGAIAPKHAVDVVVGLLQAIAAHGLAARAADVLSDGGLDAIRARFRIEPSAGPPPRPLVEMIGLHPLRDGSLALGLALAFGHAQADTLAELARIAGAHGVRSIGTAPNRALMLMGVSLGDADGLAAAAEQLGFIVRAGDPRRRIAACPGAPACSSGFIDARRFAAALAPQLAGLRGGIAVHVSGCAKGCAHPAPAPLTVVGSAHGCGIVRNGTARAAPCVRVAPGNLAAEIARAIAEGEAVHG